MKHFIPLIIFLLLTACGSNGDTVTDTSIPNVAGTYAFNTSTFYGECADNSSDSFPGIAFNIIITQNLNTLTATRESGDGLVGTGITVVSSSGTTGNVQTDGTFILNQYAQVTIDGLTGIQTVSYNQTGVFSSSGWSGAYEYTVILTDYSVSCTYTTTFSGSKVASKPTTEIQEYYDTVLLNESSYPEIGAHLRWLLFSE